MNRQRLGRLAGIATAVLLPATVTAVALPHSDAAGAAAAAVTYAPNVKVMTYNVRHSPVDPDHPNRTWDGASGRRDEVVALMASNKPAVMGVQEATRGGGLDQPADIVSLLSAQEISYGVYPAIADTPNRSQQQVYWLTSRFSQTVNPTTGAPEGGVATYPQTGGPGGASCDGGGMTWTVLQDSNPVSDGWPWNTYIVASAHLSAGSACAWARPAQATGIMSTLQDVRDRVGALPIILTGDFNAERPSCGPSTEQTIPTILGAPNSVHTFTLLAALDCTKPKTGNKGWDDNLGNDVDQIDYVFFSKERFNVGTPTGVDRTFNYTVGGITTSPSDHYPVISTLARK